MTREELKQMVNICDSYHSCGCCPYNPYGKTICSDLDTEDITDIIDELLEEQDGKDKD